MGKKDLIRIPDIILLSLRWQYFLPYSCQILQKLFLSNLSVFQACRTLAYQPRPTNTRIYSRHYLSSTIWKRKKNEDTLYVWKSHPLTLLIVNNMKKKNEDALYVILLHAVKFQIMKMYKWLSMFFVERYEIKKWTCRLSYRYSLLFVCLFFQIYALVWKYHDWHVRDIFLHAVNKINLTKVWLNLLY